MRRFKKQNKNKKFIKLILNKLKEYNIKDVSIGSGYFIFNFYKYDVLHFTLPNNYKIGIWQHSKDIFCEHLGNIDKFKPSAVEYSIKYSCPNDILNFVEYVSKLQNKDGEDSLKNEEELLHMAKYVDDAIYTTLNNMEDVVELNLRHCNDDIFHRNKLDIVLKNDKVSIEDIRNKIDILLDFYLSQCHEVSYHSKFYNIFSKSYHCIDWYYIN